MFLLICNVDGEIANGVRNWIQPIIQLFFLLFSNIIGVVLSIELAPIIMGKSSSKLVPCRKLANIRGSQPVVLVISKQVN